MGTAGDYTGDYTNIIPLFRELYKYNPLQEYFIIKFEEKKWEMAVGQKLNSN